MRYTSASGSDRSCAMRRQTSYSGATRGASPGQALHLHRRRPQAGLELEDVALCLVAADVPHAHAQRRGLAQQQRYHLRLQRLLTEHGEHHGGPALLHLDRREPDVRGARCQQRLLRVGQQFGRHVVDVRLDQAQALARGLRLAQPDAQDVRPVRRVAPAGAVANLVDAHRRTLEAAQRRQQRRARRRHQLATRPLALDNRRPGPRDQLQRRRRGQRQHAVPAA